MDKLLEIIDGRITKKLKNNNSANIKTGKIQSFNATTNMAVVQVLGQDNTITIPNYTGIILTVGSNVKVACSGNFAQAENSCVIATQNQLDTSKLVTLNIMEFKPNSNDANNWLIPTGYSIYAIAIPSFLNLPTIETHNFYIQYIGYSGCIRQYVITVTGKQYERFWIEGSWGSWSQTGNVIIGANVGDDYANYLLGVNSAGKVVARCPDSQQSIVGSLFTTLIWKVPYPIKRISKFAIDLSFKIPYNSDFYTFNGQITVAGTNLPDTVGSDIIIDFDIIGHNSLKTNVAFLSGGIRMYRLSSQEQPEYQLMLYDEAGGELPLMLTILQSQPISTNIYISANASEMTATIKDIITYRASGSNYYPDKYTGSFY